MRPASNPAPLGRPSLRARVRRLGALGLIGVALVTCSEPTTITTPGGAAKLVFTTQPVAATAGQTMANVVVTVRDDNNNTAVSFTGNVTLTITTGTGTAGATLAGTVTVAAVAGVVTFSDLRINRSGAGYTLTANSAGLTLVAPSASFTINAGPAAVLAFTSQPLTTTAGASLTPAVVVTARDVNGNTATSFTSAIAISFGTNPVAGTLSGTTSINAAAGVATFSTLKVNKVGTGYTLKATSLALTEDISASFNINPGLAATLVFTAQPTNVVAGVAVAPSVQVTALDGQGNVATGFTASVTLGFANNAGGGTLSGGTASAAAGIATFAAVSVDKSGTGYTLSATSGSLTAPVASSAFNVAAAGANKVAFSVQASNVVAGAAITPAVQAQIQDAFGNLVSSTASITVAIGTNPGTSTLGGGATTLSAVGGVATFTGLTLNKTGVGYTLTAASTGLTTATGTAFNVTPGAANKLAFGATLPASVVAGVAIAPAITVRILDANDNLTTSTATVGIAIGTNPGTATLGGTASLAAVAGVATFSTLTLNKVGTGYTLLASSTVPATLTGATSSTFNVTPATASKLIFTSQPAASTVAGVNIGGPITVSAQDQFGNVDPTFVASVTLGFANNPGGGTLGGTVIKAATAGLVTFSDIKITKAATGYTLQATSGSLTQGTSAGFAITADVAAQLAFTAQPAVTAVAGQPLNAGLAVSVQDQFGNLQSFAGSVTLTLASGPGLLFTDPSPSATGVASVAATITNGVATFASLNIHQAATGYKLNANTTGLTAGASILFDVKAAAADHLVYDQNLINGTAGVTQSPTVKVSARDPYGNLDGDFTGATKNVTLTVASGPAGTLVNAVATPTAGLATFTTFNIQTSGIGRTLTATGGGLNVASASFDITAAAANHLVFTGQPADAVAGVAIVGVSGAVQVTALDQFNNVDLTYSTSVVLSVNSGPGAAVLDQQSANASAGLATFDLFNVHTAGTYTLKANSGTLVATPPVSASFVISPADDHHLSITAQPGNVVAGFTISAVTVQILDQFNNLTTSTATVDITIGANPGTATLGGTKTLAAVGGVVTFSTLTLDKVGTGYTLAANSTVPATLTGATSNTFNVTNSIATKLAFTSQPAAAVAGVNIGGPITVSAQDQFGNLVPSFTSSVTLAFANNAGGGTLSGTLIKAAVGGSVTFSDITINKAAGGYTLQASSGSLAQGTSNGFAITPASAFQLAFTTQPPVLAVAGVSLGAQVSVQDQFGNLQPAFTGDVIITKNLGPGPLYTSPLPAAGSVASVTVTITSGGVATFSTLNIHLAGTGYKLDANSTGLAGGSSILFDVKAAPADHLVYDQNLINGTAGVTQSPVVKLSALDPYDNLDKDFTGAPKTVTLTETSGPTGTLVNATSAPIAGVVTFNTFNIQTVGTYTLDASGGGLTLGSASFDINPAAANHLVFTVEPVDAVAGVAVSGPSGPVVVTALDQFNNVDVNYSTAIVLGINTGPASPLPLNQASVVPGAGTGVATFTAFNVRTSGTYTLNATSAALGPPAAAAPVSSSIAITAAPANHLAFTVQPVNTVAGVAISGPSGPVKVTALDEFDNIDLAYATAIDLGINTGPASPKPLLLASVSPAAGTGVATFTGFNARTAGTYTLNATSAALGPPAAAAPISTSFLISPAVVSQLAFITQPANTRAKHIMPSFQVAAQDQFDNTNPTWTTDITATLTANPGSSTLGGTTTASTGNGRLAGGVATFNDLQIDKGGAGYVFQAASGALPTKQSTGFAILALYVSNIALGANNIPIYPSDAGNVGAGNIAPTAVVVGGNTGLNQPGGITLDAQGNLYAANAGSITVYAPGATGNATPVRTITAAAGVNLGNAFGVVVDAAGLLYVADGQAPGSILVYAANANGAATPVRTITGASTGLGLPEGVALDGAGNIYVANTSNSTVTVYAPNADGDATPIATIPTTSGLGVLDSPTAIALDGVGNVYVANQGGSGSLNIYAPLTSGTPLAFTATITGASTGLSSATGVALDGGLIYVGNSGSNSVTVYPVGTLGGNIAPTFLIQGASTQLNQPFGVAF